MVSIPVGWWVTPEDRQYIVDTIKKRVVNDIKKTN